ncbi:hypothetical protein Gotri_027840 [Gossypium trilobum]|uniref:DUF7745 domain-containing protein n=1 Tax=Gossypium trilobum TaxID=34281 RepID=A0A7J9FH44_9ROSI|nr:hypothetical protein [Gossypium trilobum]
MTKLSSYSTESMEIHIIYSMSKYISTYFELLPNTKKRVDVFVLSIYRLVIFPKALGHIDVAVSDLFDWLDKRVTPVPIILAETFRSLSTCRRIVFSKDYSLLKEFIVPQGEKTFLKKSG